MKHYKYKYLIHKQSLLNRTIQVKYKFIINPVLIIQINGRFLIFLKYKIIYLTEKPILKYVKVNQLYNANGQKKLKIKKTKISKVILSTL